MFHVNTLTQAPKHEDTSISLNKFFSQKVENDIIEQPPASKIFNTTAPIFSKISLIYKKEPTVSLSSFYYLGNNYFIGFISSNIILQIKLFNELYKLWIHPELEVNILEINVNKNSSSDVVIIRTLSDEYFDNLQVLNIITPEHFLSCEQLSNKYVCIDDTGKENWIKVDKITTNYLIVQNQHLNVVKGAQLICKNQHVGEDHATIVGIFSHIEGFDYFFYRLSSVYEWICQYSPHFSNKNLYNNCNQQMPFYTKEQLLNIILHLNEKIDAMSAKLEEIDKHTLKTSFKLLSDSNEIKKEEQIKNMVGTINHLTNKLTLQEQQTKQILLILKKLGFNS
jgi:hypothetical protein